MLVQVDATGVVVHVSADISGWWVDAISEVEAAAGGMLGNIDVHLDIRYAVPDKPLDVVAPCSAPTTEIENGIETLVCLGED